MDMTTYLGNVQLKAGLEISTGTFDASGTLGAIVYDANDASPMILTNMHVVLGLTAVEQSDVKSQVKKTVDLLLTKFKASALDLPEEVLSILKSENPYPVFYPKAQGGTNRDAKIVAFVERWDKETDAAVCRLLPNVRYESAYDEGMILKPVAEPPIEKYAVTKIGKTTGRTVGIVKQVTGQLILIERVGGKESKAPLADPGDSGSLWIDAQRKAAVGLLHKGDANFSYAYSAKLVAQRLAIKYNR